MNRFQWIVSAIAILVASCATVSCSPGGVGDPCIPEDEYDQEFAGYGVEEVNVEAMSFQCATRLCLVNHFQGRVTCPYGQNTKDNGDLLQTSPSADQGGLRCKIPDGSKNLVSVEVLSQLVTRRANNSVYCSCRCAGPDKTARYCSCPSGFSCTLLNEIPLGSGGQLLGSYCVRNGTAYDKARDTTEQTCLASRKNCDYEGYPSGQNPFGTAKQ
jgi:hypothetical protein